MRRKYVRSATSMPARSLRLDGLIYLATKRLLVESTLRISVGVMAVDGKGTLVLNIRTL